MAQATTLHHFAIDLANVDRDVYRAFEFKAARHPSESGEYFAVRVLAYALEHAEGIAFSKGGISDPDEPAIVIRDLTGAIRSWIEIGTPSAERLHKASKSAPRVAAYLHRDPAPYVKQLARERIHRASEIELYVIERPVIDSLAARLERRMSLGVSVTESRLFVTVGSDVIDGAIERVAIAS